MNEETEKKIRSASKSKLPIASVIPDHDTFTNAVALMREGNELKVQAELLEQRKREIGEELASICEAYELDGFRHGLNGFEYHGYTTRKTLNKERLLAEGVAADVIERSYVDSKPFLNVRLVKFDLE